MHDLHTRIVAQLQDAVRSLEAASRRPTELSGPTYARDPAVVLRIGESEPDLQSAATRHVHDAVVSLDTALTLMPEDHAQRPTLLRIRDTTTVTRDENIPDGLLFQRAKALYRDTEAVLHGLRLEWNLEAPPPVSAGDLDDDLRGAGLGFLGVARRYAVGLGAIALSMFGLGAVFLVSDCVKRL